MSKEAKRRYYLKNRERLLRKNAEWRANNPNYYKDYYERTEGRHPRKPKYGLMGRPDLPYVYIIKNLINSKVYVGSSIQAVSMKMNEYRKKLRDGNMDNRQLQDDWTKYGESNFLFTVVCQNIPPDKRYEVEQAYIDSLSSRVYNMITAVVNQSL